MIEYIVVTLFCVMLLMTNFNGGGSVITRLENAVKSFFSAYSYAISVAPQSP